MEILDDNQQSENNLTINNEIFSFLTETGKWAKFLSILGFIGIGLLVILAFFMGSIFNSMPTNPYSQLPSMFITILYLAMALLYFFPVYYLYNFAVKLKNSLLSGNQQELAESFRNLKSHYKFIGIFAIIILAIYGVMLVIGLIAGFGSLM
jgi:hypothetical protein